jgi:hypothetical protein
MVLLYVLKVLQVETYPQNVRFQVLMAGNMKITAFSATVMMEADALLKCW